MSIVKWEIIDRPEVLFPSGSGVSIREIKFNGHNYHATLHECDGGGCFLIHKAKSKTMENAIVNAWHKTDHHRSLGGEIVSNSPKPTDERG